ncbi:fatty acyl-CoA reductase wat-like [Contarinia nasturtii]|uniref:fatty acyl-CoA reductase wat-like n=1 Tax=Contarinia nasturtii TaxID=265458 RepID=UPI0012D4778F|nr:fatty acyl-CoA reductase wat-like [Contarinia nasturtii]
MNKLTPLEINDFWSDDSIPDSTPMRDFYRGKVILLTGGTGFLGQIYVEKLLRCEVKMLYVLTRPKKGKSAMERLCDLYSGPLFVLLQKIDPNYMDRVRAIDGNTRELKVGLTDEIRSTLTDSVNIILHAAADVRFDNTLKELSLVNLRGTRELLKLAEECKHLEMFAYISTAFSHCVRKYIEEKFYEAPIDPEDMIRIAEHFEDHNEDESVLDIITESFVWPWPNTYSFSKALSEELMRQYGQRIPIVVIRPSIVIATHEDPIPAWCNNIYGLNGMLVACGLGFLRIMVFDRDLKGDIICADFVTNSTLAAIWDRYNELKLLNSTKEAIADVSKSGGIVSDANSDQLTEIESKVYNVTSKDDEVTWGHISDTMRDMLIMYPTTKSIWCHLTNTTRYRIMEFFLVILYHAIPGLIFDFVLKFTKNPRRLMPLYRKTHLFMVKLRYFMTQQWTFCNKNMYAVYERMCDHDKAYFPSDVRNFQWDAYCYNYNLGLLRYIGNETIEDFEPARRRMRKFHIAHLFVLAIYYTLLALLYYYLGRLFGINNLISSQIQRINDSF